MKDFLTDRNGVICNHCHATIDITGRKMKDPPKPIQTLRKFFGDPQYFTITCDTCKKQSTHQNSEIKPIVNWIQKEKEYQDTITKLKTELEETKDHATLMARKIVSDAEQKRQEVDIKPQSEPDKTKSTLYK